VAARSCGDRGDRSAPPGTSVCPSEDKQMSAPPGAPRAQTTALEGECPHEPKI